MLSGKLAGAKAAIAGALAMIMAATAAGAAVLPAPVVDASISGVQLAAGNVCGPGAQQGANGVCHPQFVVRPQKDLSVRNASGPHGPSLLAKLTAAGRRATRRP